MLRSRLFSASTMIYLQRNTLLAAGALFTALTTNIAFASDMPFGFRGISLGNSVHLVKKLASNEFPVVSQQSHTEPILLSASDAVGAERNECPSDPFDKSPAKCIKADFYFDRTLAAPELIWISVHQSFAVPVASETVIAKLEEAYGTVRHRYEGRNIFANWDSTGGDDIGLVWGGKKLPKGPYRPRPSNLLYLDNEDIGGKFITAVIYSSKGNATGYRLLVVDGDRLSASSELRKEGIRRQREEQQKQSVEALKF